MSGETPKPNAPPPIIVRNACIQHKKDYEKKKGKKKGIEMIEQLGGTYLGKQFLLISFE